MKRTFIKILKFSPLIFIAVIVLLFKISCPINDKVSRDVVKELKQIPLPAGTVVVEEKAIADRLCGNGDGVQYFGALLLKSDLSLEELDEYYAQYRNDNACYRVEHQYDSEIKQDKLSLHQDNSFETTIDSDNYYILYAWGNYDSMFTYLDWRGIN